MDAFQFEIHREAAKFSSELYAATTELHATRHLAPRHRHRIFVVLARGTSLVPPPKVLRCREASPLRSPSSPVPFRRRPVQGEAPLTFLCPCAAQAGRVQCPGALALVPLALHLGGPGAPASRAQRRGRPAYTLGHVGP